MRRSLLAAVAILSAGMAASEAPPKRLGTPELLAGAVENTKAGAWARARLVNEASKRADELIAALKHEDDDVRVSAAWALRYAGKQEKVIAALERALRDENFSVGRAAAVSLNKFKAADEPLRRLMRDSDHAMRWRGMINVEHLRLTALMEDVARLAVSDEVDFVRAASAWTLRHGSGAKVAEALVKCLADPHGWTRARARSSLLGGKVSAAVKRRGSPVRRRVLGGLLKILETHRGKTHATSGAVSVLKELVIDRIGADPARWRKVVSSLEGGE